MSKMEWNEWSSERYSPPRRGQQHTCGITRRKALLRCKWGCPMQPRLIAELYPLGIAIEHSNCLIRIYSNTLHDPRRWHMPVKQFFDGSWGDPHHRHEILSLAAICATEKAWADFDGKWATMLRKHNLGDANFHMTDMMAKPPRDA